MSVADQDSGAAQAFWVMDALPRAVSPRQQFPAWIPLENHMEDGVSVGGGVGWGNPD